MFKLIIADDYHDLGFVASCLPGTIAVEIGTTDDNGYTQYVGVLYDNHPPSCKDIAKLLKKNQVTTFDEA